MEDNKVPRLDLSDKLDDLAILFANLLEGASPKTENTLPQPIKEEGHGTDNDQDTDHTQGKVRTHLPAPID